MMATAAAVVVGLSAGTGTGTGTGTGKRILTSSYYSHPDFGDKLLLRTMPDRCSSTHLRHTPTPAVSRRSSSGKLSQASSPPAVRAFKELMLHHPPHSSATFHDLEDDLGYSLDALLLLQKSMLESQWNLCFQGNPTEADSAKEVPVTCSGISARERRLTIRRRKLSGKQLFPNLATGQSIPKQLRSAISPELLHNRFKGYVKGVISNELLSHSEVVRLSDKIKVGLSLEKQKSKLKERLGCDPSDEQLATSLRISRTELQAKLVECTLAREKLAMSNIRLVMSIAQRYDNVGAEMSDLIQGGLIGLLRGIEKFDSSKGFKISTYVYWWIRQGVSRALVENSRTLRLPVHLHERLGLIRNAKVRLEEKGITPSVDRIAESLSMSVKKVRNATEAAGKVFSLDRDAFPSLNGIPGETHHNYIADNHLENHPWHGVDQWALKDEVNRLLDVTLGEREQEIIRLYYGLDNECLTWEDISKRIGLSRERVRQVGLVALEKLKHVARKRRMEAMLVKH